MVISMLICLTQNHFRMMIMNKGLIHRAQQHYILLFCVMNDADAFGFAMDYLREVYLNEKQ